jgi:cytochrome P450
MIFSEGENWKNKRRIISKVFNFDLIKANIPKINAICDRWLDEFDQTYKM